MATTQAPTGSSFALGDRRKEGGDQCEQCENNVHVRAGEACDVDDETVGALHVDSRESRHRSTRGQSSDASGGLSCTH